MKRTQASAPRGIVSRGTERLSESGYFRAKIAQEKMIKSSTIPYTIVQATSSFEFLKALPTFPSLAAKCICQPVLFQPMAADDVATGVGRIAVGPPGKRHRRNWRPGKVSHG